MVRERQDGRLPDLNEIREAVKQDWTAERQKELKDAAYAKIRERYTVIVESPKAGAAPLDAAATSRVMTAMMRFALPGLVLLACPGRHGSVSAHESQPGTLDLRQVDKNRYEVTWRAPIYFGQPHPARLELARALEDRRGADGAPALRLATFPPRRDRRQPGGGGEHHAVPRPENTITDVFVRLNRLDGTTMTAVVRPSKPFAQLRGERTWYTTAGEYVGLGFHHILQGVDHLLFVLGLLLIVKGRLTLLKTVTAFTVAHSITLAIATLGLARAPLPPLNAAIALSILFLGPEIVRSWRGDTSLTIRYPWVVAFLFGLLHGFGFASGLTTTGCRGRAAARAALLQRRRRTGPACLRLHGPGARAVVQGARGPLAALGRGAAGLHGRQPRRVLDDPADGHAAGGTEVSARIPSPSRGEGKGGGGDGE